MLNVSQLCPQSLLGTQGMGGYPSLAEDGVPRAPHTQILPMDQSVSRFPELLTSEGDGALSHTTPSAPFSPREWRESLPWSSAWGFLPGLNLLSDLSVHLSI